MFEPYCQQLGYIPADLGSYNCVLNQCTCEINTPETSIPGHIIDAAGHTNGQFVDPFFVDRREEDNSLILSDKVNFSRYVP